MYSTFFVNNKTYGADDINKVFAHLTTQGVSLFNDTGDALMDLDTAMANLVNPGVDAYNFNSCKVVSAGNGYYKISKGCCWMPSGACIIFDDEGYVFELNFINASGTKGTTCYVYLRQGGADSDGVSNEINVVVSGEAPEDTDLIFATISSAGAITDKRVYSQAKIYVPNLNTYMKKSFSIPATYGSITETSVTIEVGYEGFMYAYPLESLVSTGEAATFQYQGLVELSEDKVYFGREAYQRYFISKNQSNITIYAEGISSGSNNVSQRTLNIMLF